MLRLIGVSKQIDKFKIDDINLTVEKGDYFIIAGESGSGKTSVLELIAGIRKPDCGQILLESKIISHSSMQERQIGMVFQNLALFPHYNVFENIAFALRNTQYRPAEIRKKVYELAELNAITHTLSKKITNISGGEQQRVALARVLAMNPKVLLLDEPLNSVDIQRKNELCSFLRKINKQGQTIIHVTHDFDEAISLGSHISIMKNGSIIQQGIANEIMQNPKSEFLANFIGRYNFFKYEIIDNNEENYSIVKISNSIKAKIKKVSSSETNGYLIIPEEKISIYTDLINKQNYNSFEGIVKDIFRFKYGVKIIVKSEIEFAIHYNFIEFNERNIDLGQKVFISFDVESVNIIK